MIESYDFLHLEVVHMPGSEENNLTEWFQRYGELDGNDISKDSDVLQAVNSDELPVSFIEQRIRESTPKAPATRGFCVKCQDLFDNWPSLGSSSTRNHDSKPDLDEDGWEYAVARSCSTFELEASARSGCRFCTFLLQSLKDVNLLDTFRKIEARLYHLDKEAIASLCIQNWGTNPSQLLWLNLPGKICTSCNSGLASTVKFDSTFLPASADCYDNPRDVFEVASNWLSTCSESHELCKNNENTLPTRLISITGESLRLVLSSEYHKRPRYATLSHSWGSHDVIKLTSDNMDDFMTAILVERLPATFKDAIKIAQRLGLDALWVDSLCILQDSEDDWQKESALMSSVYGGSTINIAASSARDSSQGCFLKPLNFSGGLRARITDGGRQRVQDFRSSNEYNLSTFDTHLGSRAWALQEKLLPPRTIHLGDRGAFWECRMNIASEYLPDGFPRILVFSLVRRKTNFEGLWPQIVRLYSTATLTFGKDKLPALSGVARLGHDETGDEYLAGLWRRQIEEQLCWRRWVPKTIAKRPTWRAPTWSWASIDGKVLWYRLQKGILDTQHAHVLDASTAKYGHDPFGQVTSGVIRLGCSTMASGYLVFSDKTNEVEAETDIFIMLRVGNEDKEFLIQLDCSDDIRSGDNELVYLLPLLSGKTGTGTILENDDCLDEFMIEGIVLRPNPTKGEFSRIGSFHFYKDRALLPEEDSGGEEAYKPFFKVLEDYGVTIAEAVCAEIITNSRYPEEKFVITLV